MRFLLLLLLLQDPAELVDRLGAEDLEAREAAAAALLEKGEASRVALEKAAGGAKDQEVRSRAKALIAELDRRLVVTRIQCEIVLPEKAPARWEVNTGAFAFKLRITNTNAFEVVVPVLFTLSLLDKEGKPVDQISYGGWGGGSTGCMLPMYATHTFKTVASKASVEIESRLDSAAREMNGGGWRLAAAGEYTIVITPRYSRDAFMGRCRKNCASHANENQPWNRATVLRDPVRKNFTVEAGKPLACEAHRKEPGEAAVEHAAWSHLEGGKCASCAREATTSCGEKHAEVTAKLCVSCAGARGACALCK
jgi:hypothetical protein